MKGKNRGVFSPRRILRTIIGALNVTMEDRVTVYAAQASFFIVISTIPFIMLLFSLSSFILPDRVYSFIVSFGQALPGSASEFFMTLVDEMYAKPAINIISLTAAVALWTASRGIGAVRGGIATVYKSDSHKSFVKRTALSLMYTLVFIVLIIALVGLMLFGEQLNALLIDKIKFLSHLQGVFKYRTVIFFVFLTFFFTGLYYSVGRGGGTFGKRISEHFPGAVLASAGWVLFSYFYSLYTVYFSRVSYIYGSLTAIVLLMLWLYFCMIILLCGAEVNKLCSTRKVR